MANLKEALDKLKFDKRMVQLNIQNKVVTEGEYNQHLSNLEDLSSSADNLELEHESSVSSEESEQH